MRVSQPVCPACVHVFSGRASVGPAVLSESVLRIALAISSKGHQRALPLSPAAVPGGKRGWRVWGVWGGGGGGPGPWTASETCRKPCLFCVGPPLPSWPPPQMQQVHSSPRPSLWRGAGSDPFWPPAFPSRCPWAPNSLTRSQTPQGGRGKDSRGS